MGPIRDLSLTFYADGSLHDVFAEGINFILEDVQHETATIEERFSNEIQ